MIMLEAGIPKIMRTIPFLIAVLLIGTPVQAKYAGGTGEPNDPYKIATAEDLILLGESPEDYDKHFILTADIDLDPNLPFDRAIIAPDTNDVEDGFQGTPFTGVFNGGGLVISNLHITGEDYLGLFGELGPGAEVRNLALTVVYVMSSGHSVGGLAGSNEGRIVYCQSAGTISGYFAVGGLVGISKEGDIVDCYCMGGVNGWSWIGGLVGNNMLGPITNCYSTGTVNGSLAVGGLIGINQGSSISWSHSIAEVTATSSVDTDARDIGGLVGENRLGSISCSYSVGTITGDCSYIGGLVGSNSERSIILSSCSLGRVHGNAQVGGLVGANSVNSTISNSHSSSEVIGTISGVGGLVGTNAGSITTSYSTGMVDGKYFGRNVGGLVGVAQFTAITTLSFWDVETSGLLNMCGGDEARIPCDDSFGKTTAEMMDPNTFLDAGWDFMGETVNGPNDIWWILEGKDYPRLWWQLPADEFEDGQTGPLWFVYEMEPELARLEEVNGRLEVNTAGAMEDIDAIYVSDGWRLDTNEPFAVRVDFYFSKVGVGDGRVTLGLVPTIEEPVVQWAQFEVGTFDDRPFYLYEVRNRTWVEEKVTDRYSDDGTLYASYDPDTDELYFSHTGYGKVNAMWIVPGLVSGRWQSESVFITLGGGCEGMVLTGEDAWLDNFAVDAGSIVQ